MIKYLARSCYLAPSAGDVHPYRIVLVRERPKRKELASACYGQEFVTEAPVSMVFFVDQGAASQWYGKRGTDLYSLLDVGAAVENLMLAAVDIGLGTCWVGAFDEEAANSLLGAPPGWRAVSVITIGHPAGEPRHIPPPPLANVIYSEGCHARWSRS